MGKAFSIGANYAHVLAAEDLGFQALIQGKEALAEAAWAGRTGMSEPVPLGPGADLKGWSRRAKLDLAAMRRYGQAVQAASHAHLATMRPEDVERPIDLSRFGFGEQTVFFVLTAMLANTSLHTGEISCLKGAQGLKGYPV